MSKIGEPKITPCQSDEEDFTMINFEPDLKKFGMSGLDDDTFSLL
jgi:DNA topoisomerase-2